MTTTVRCIWKAKTPVDASVEVVSMGMGPAWSIFGPEGGVVIYWPAAEWRAFLDVLAGFVEDAELAERQAERAAES